MLRCVPEIKANYNTMLRNILFSIIVLFLICATEMVAEESFRISNVIVKGNERISTDTVLAKIDLHTGDQYSSIAADESIKNLYEMGVFSEVNISINGNAVTIDVKENPMINQVAFEGNSKIKTDVLEKEIRLKSRMVLSKARILQAKERLISIYQKHGYYGTQINPQMINLSDNRVDVVFEIKENRKTLVKRVIFVGNNHFANSTLADVILTQEARWYRFFASDDIYDPDRVAYDRELIERYYANHGYADAQVTHVNVDLTPDKKGFYITYTIYEGAKYKFGNFSIDNNIENVNTNEVENLVTLKTGDNYNEKQVYGVVDDITKYLGERGFAFAEVDPVLKRDHVNNVIDIVFGIKNAPRFYVNQINIHGNTRTLDNVIRRNFKTAEGDPYNARDIQRAEQKIRDLDYFSNLTVTKKRVEGAGNKIDIDVSVIEKSTGSLNLGVGYSSVAGALSKISYTENNLLGRGYESSIGLLYAKSDIDLDFSFTNPSYMDKNLSLGFDIDHNKSRRQSDHNYSTSDDVITLRMGYNVTERLTHSLRYKIGRTNIRDIPNNASLYVKDQAGRRVLSQIGQSLYYSKLDSELNPTMGYYLIFNQDFAGLGGNIKTIKHEVGAGYYRPLITDQIILQLTARSGIISGWGDYRTRIVDRFFMGGDDVRCFKLYGIGPRDVITGDSLGGKRYYRGRAQLEMPLNVIKDMGMKGFVFSDVGDLTKVDLPKGASYNNLYDQNIPRVSVGIGASFSTPVGKIGLSVGKAVRKGRLDKTRIFNFSLGTAL